MKVNWIRMEKIPVAAERRPAATHTTPTHNSEAPQHLSHAHRPLTLTRSSLVWGNASSWAGSAVTHSEERVQRGQGSKGARVWGTRRKRRVEQRQSKPRQASVGNASNAAGEDQFSRMQIGDTGQVHPDLGRTPAPSMEPPAAGTTQGDGSSRGVLLYLSPRVVLIVASLVATQGSNGRS